MLMVKWGDEGSRSACQIISIAQGLWHLIDYRGGKDACMVSGMEISKSCCSQSCNKLLHQCFLHFFSPCIVHKIHADWCSGSIEPKHQSNQVVLWRLSCTCRSCTWFCETTAFLNNLFFSLIHRICADDVPMSYWLTCSNTTGFAGVVRKRKQQRLLMNLELLSRQWTRK